MPTISSTIRRLRCSRTGNDVPHGDWQRPIGLCPCCPPPGMPVVVDYDLEAVGAAISERPPSAGRGPGLTRFEALLPVCDLPEEYAGDVGATPVLTHRGLSRATGARVLIKNEASNPSGSFKDRGLAIAIALGQACGAERFCLPTQGNAGVAAALFSARAGLPGCLVYMPDGYQDGIYHREADHFGAEVRFAGSNIAAAGRTMRADNADDLASGALVELSTFFEPGRLEGKKTMGLELVEQLGPDGLPDWILYPTGGGTGLVGIWKAFEELAELGTIDRARHLLPKMVAVQSTQCAPIVQAFERGLEVVEPVESLGTIADGLDVPGAIMGHEILRVLRASGGTAVAVTEEEIVTASGRCGRLGVAAAYETAALLAALHRLRAAGSVREDERVLLLATSSHLIPLGNR